MSFSTDTKNELARVMPEKTCCKLAEIAGFLRTSSGLRLTGPGQFTLVVSTENPAAARHYKKLIEDYYDISTKLEIGESEGVRRAKTYSLTIGPDMRSEFIMRETGMILVRQGHNYFADGIYDELVRTKCCRKAYLRGIFLGCGMVTDPDKSYHLEFVVDHEALANDLRKLIGSFVDLSAKVTERKGKYIVYIKNSQYISDMLAIMGAHSQVLKMEDTKIRKELVSEAIRLTNCDTANTDRILDAAARQLRAISEIEKREGLESLPPKLRELAILRRDNPEISLTQLGEMMDPQVQKSGVNKRMKKIEEIAFGKKLS